MVEVLKQKKYASYIKPDCW